MRAELEAELKTIENKRKLNMPLTQREKALWVLYRKSENLKAKLNTQNGSYAYSGFLGDKNQWH